MPFVDTWSCYKGGERHCGRCGTCVERREGFDLAGIADPTEYAAGEVTWLTELQVPDGLRIRLRIRTSAGGFTVIRADGRVWRNDERALHIDGVRALTTSADLALSARDGSA